MHTLFDGLEPKTISPGTLRDRVRKRAWRLVHQGLAADVQDAIDRILRIRRRQNRYQYSYKYVRLVRATGGSVLFQSRAWHPVVGSVNIGLFRSEREAIVATQRWIRAGCDPCQGLAEGVLPKWVRRTSGGKFVAVFKQKGGDRHTTSEFATAVDAHQAMVNWLKSVKHLPTS
jgi:hypothetical protein